MELLERESLLLELSARWDATRQGQGGMAFSGGEAGVGKSSVVRAFIELISSRGRVLVGMCDPLSTPRPLGPLIDMVTGTGGDLEHLVTRGTSRDRLFPLVLADLRREPALMVVEDVHWADESTLDLLRYLGRRVGDAPAMVVATYRNDAIDADHPLRQVLGDLATAHGFHRLVVEPLSEQGVRTLAADSTSDPAHLYRITSGNPFYVTEVLASGGEGIPPTIRDAVLARAARLPPEARRALEAAAVVGSVVEPWILHALIEDRESIDACLIAGMLQQEPGGYAFRHELARVAILEAIPSERRSLFDAAVLARLEATEELDRYIAQLAHHAEQVADAERVLRYARRAAELARAVDAHREAVAQLRRAVRFAGGLEPHRRAELLTELAEECMATSEFDLAIIAFQQAMVIQRAAGHHLNEAAALAGMGAALMQQGRNAEAESVLADAVELLRGLPESDVHAKVYASRAFFRMLDRDHVAAIEWGTRALAIAERFDDRYVVARCENAIGSALMMVDHFEEGRTWLERSREHAETVGNHALVAAAHINLGSAAGEFHRFRYAREQLVQAIAVGREFDLDGIRLYAESWLALCELYLGNWEVSGQLAANVVRQPNAAVIARIMALLALGRLRARRGDSDVWEALDEAEAMARQTGTLQRVGPVATARAEAAWLEGNLTQYATEAEAAYDLALERGHAWFVGEMAYWRWKAGTFPSVPAEAATPFRHQMEGDWQAAAAFWEKRECPYEAARALLESSNEDALRIALATFERLGARPAAAMALKSLRELGATGIPRGPRDSTRSHPMGLTAREAEVLEQLIAGRSNAQIAEELYLSTKTVEHHVSSILAKLNVRTRAEAAVAGRSLLH